MTREQIFRVYEVLPLREKIVAQCAIGSGMRPGEILALKWKHIAENHVKVEQRLYRGKIDTPKSGKSEREVGISDGLIADLKSWRELSNCDPEAWVFPSENGRTPLAKDNLWRRSMLPKLREVGLEWATFQVMRRTHSSQLEELHVEPKLIADNMGHTLDVNRNTYTITEVANRKRAVDLLEDAVFSASTSVN